MNKTTKESLVEKFERDRDGTKYYSLSEKEMGNLISQAHTAGHKEALEGVLEVVEGMKEQYKCAGYDDYGTHHENICHDDGYNDALTDIKNHLES